MSETQAIHAFKQSLKKGTHFHFMVFSDQSTSLGGLLACANKYAATDDDNREDLDSRRKSQPSKKSGDDKPALQPKSQKPLAKAARTATTGEIKSRRRSGNLGLQR